MQHWRVYLDLKKTFTTGETFRFLKVAVRIDEPVLQAVASILGKKVTPATRAELEMFVRLNAPVWIANALYPGDFRAVEIMDEGPLDCAVLDVDQARRLPLGLTFWVLYDTAGETELLSERRTSASPREVTEPVAL